MRLAVLSDLHFGDPTCVVVEKRGKIWGLRPDVEDRLECLRDLDLVVLLGDIFDLSIECYAEAFAASRPFLALLKDIGVKKLLYCPGNHDAMMWHAIEYETRVTRPLAEDGVAKDFRSALPAIVRTDKDSIDLPGVEPPLGDIFLTKFTKIPTIVSYPNVYLVTPAFTVLLSHGQYLESYWAAGGELVHELAGDELRLGGVLSIKQLVDFNHPLTQLACTGVGQAGELTGIARAVQREVKDGNIGPGSKIDKYLSRLKSKLDKVLAFKGFWSWVKEKASDKALDFAFDWLRNELKGVEKARGNTSWLHTEGVRERFEAFYQASLAELDAINGIAPGADKIPDPAAVVLGHTHVPEAWASYYGRIGSHPVSICNTGGWLSHDSAQILFFDGKKFSSIAVWDKLLPIGVAAGG